MLKVAIHQINYLPWIGFFSKIASADMYVVLDIATYTRGSWINRNRIKVPPNRVVYLTIPIARRFKGIPIKDVKLPENKKWSQNHWATIRASYSKAEFFDSYKDFFKKLYLDVQRGRYMRLARLNWDIVDYLFRELDINVEVVWASDLDLSPGLKKTDLLIAILEAVGADVYISGMGGKNYLEEHKFNEHGIKLVYHEFKCPRYRQLWGDFVPNLSAIDLLFNEGEKAKNILAKTTLKLP